MGFNISKLKPDNAKAIVIIVVAVVVLGLGVYYVNKVLGGFGNLFGGISDALGITESPAQAALATAQQQAANPASPWSPAFYQNAPSGAALITMASANDLDSQIWGNWVTNNSDDALAAFKQLSTKSQVSFLADVFNKNHGKDLLSWLTAQYGHLYFQALGDPDPNLQAIITYVNALPNYN